MVMLRDFFFLKLLLLHLLLLDFSFVLLRHFYFIDTTVKLFYFIFISEQKGVLGFWGFGV